MPAHPATHDWDAVKTTALATGSLRDAAELHGISLAAVRQRAHRENWPSPTKLRAQAAQATQAAIVATAKARHPASAMIVSNVTPAIVTAPITASEALERHMRNMREEFQTLTATAIRNASRAASKLQDEDALDKSRKLADLVQSGTKLHGISADVPQVAVQVLNQW